MTINSPSTDASIRGFSDVSVLVIGSHGMLARDLLARLKMNEIQALGFDLPDVDITRLRELKAVIKAVSPGLVINSAAYTAVDKAESEPDLAFAVNRDGAANLAAVCDDLSIPLVHISTDYVFDGKATTPYRESDPPNPMSVYGQSKWEGEEAVRDRLPRHLIVRTAWLYGVHGHNFVKTVLRLAREREEIKIVADQYGCPTWTGDLADALVRITSQALLNPSAVDWGTYHFCGGGYTTWHGFAEAIVSERRRREPLKATKIIPIATSEYPTAAQRPAWSVLDCTSIGRIFGLVPRPWLEAMCDMFSESDTAQG